MRFLNFFPLPKYLRLPAVGIDISDRSIKYAELKRHTADELHLKTFGTKHLDKGIIESGEIKNKKKLIEHLALIRKEVGGRFFAASLPEEKAFTTMVNLPSMEKFQIRKALTVQLEELIPMPPAETIFDYELIEKSSKTGSISVVLTAFPRNIITDYMSAFKEAGIIISFLEVEGQAILRALAPKEEKGILMAIDFGKTRTTFVIGENGILRFSSTIKVGGEDIDKKLSQVLEINIFEAEKIKKQKTLGRKSHRDEEILSGIIPTISAIKDEIQRIMIYWQTHDKQHHRRKIKKILLCGGDSNLKGLTDYLSYHIQTPVEMANPWVNITTFKDYVPEIEKEESLTYATALGLSLRSQM
jgi:type IV pilus assembly protein PilM